MKLHKHLSLVLAILAVLSIWNFIAWTSVDPVVIEIQPEVNRKPASLDEPPRYQKEINSETLSVKCGEDIQHETKHSQIRLEFLDCDEVLGVKNITNHFQASMWQKGETWKSDYIPLKELGNQITYRHPASNKQYRIEIKRTKQIDDAK